MPPEVGDERVDILLDNLIEGHQVRVDVGQHRATRLQREEHRRAAEEGLVVAAPGVGEERRQLWDEAGLAAGPLDDGLGVSTGDALNDRKQGRRHAGSWHGAAQSQGHPSERAAGDRGRRGVDGNPGRAPEVAAALKDQRDDARSSTRRSIVNFSTIADHAGSKPIRGASISIWCARLGCDEPLARSR